MEQDDSEKEFALWRTTSDRIRKSARYFGIYFTIGEVAGLAGNHLHFNDENVALKSVIAGIVGTVIMDRVTRHDEGDS